MKEPTFVQVILFSVAVNVYAIAFSVGRMVHGWQHWAWGLGGWAIALTLCIAALSLPSRTRCKR